MCRTTVDDGFDDFTVVFRHGIAELFQILWSVILKDISNGIHFTGPPSQS